MLRLPHGWNVVYIVGDMHPDIDQTSLVALRALLETESVTEAARLVGSTQSNMSRTLARLRALFDDPLLVPVGRRLEKTVRARELQPRVDRALDGVRQLFSPAPAQPDDQPRLVRIAASDYGALVTLHPWMARLRDQAPGVTVDVAAIGAATIDQLVRGEIDLGIAPRLPIIGMEQFVFKKLLEDRYVCVLRRGHPLARKKLTLAQYLSLAHVMVSNLLPPVSNVQQALHRLKKTRTVAARVPGFLSALELVAVSELAVVAPERLVRAVGVDVWSCPLPFSLEPIVLNLMWHPRRTTDPQHRWMREGILAAQGYKS
jgi:DNA-binding transcriptional LysR family regulator